jgi:acyl dehydratase
VAILCVAEQEARMDVEVAILAAGLGTRLARPIPKPLTRLSTGESILRRQVDAVRQVFGPDARITVLVGFKMDLIIEALPDVSFGYNELFDSTNTSKSPLKALRQTGPSSVLWFNGDVVFDVAALRVVKDAIDRGISFVSVNAASVGEEEVTCTVDATAGSGSSPRPWRTVSARRSGSTGSVPRTSRPSPAGWPSAATTTTSSAPSSWLSITAASSCCPSTCPRSTAWRSTSRQTWPARTSSSHPDLVIDPTGIEGRRAPCIGHDLCMQFGRFYEDFEVGAVYKHWPGKTVTEYDDHLFCLLTMNHHPLHLDAHYAETSTQFGKNVVVGNYIYSLLLGMSVPDISGKAIANLEVESLRHVAPTFHGDTIYGETTVLDKKESSSKNDRGVVSVETRGYNQDGTMVCIFRRRVMVPKREVVGDMEPRPTPAE